MRRQEPIPGVSQGASPVSDVIRWSMRQQEPIPGVTKGPSPRNRPYVTLQQEPIPVLQKDRPHDTPV